MRVIKRSTTKRIAAANTDTMVQGLKSHLARIVNEHVAAGHIGSQQGADIQAEYERLIGKAVDDATDFLNREVADGKLTTETACKCRSIISELVGGAIKQLGEA